MNETGKSRGIHMNDAPQCAQEGVGQPSPATLRTGWPWRLQSGQTRYHSVISAPRKPHEAHAFELTGGPRRGRPCSSRFAGSRNRGSSSFNAGAQQSAYLGERAR